VTSNFADSAAHLFGAAALHLGWSADVFWACTPSEIMAALTPRAEPAASRLSRDQLQTMMERERNG